MPARLGIATPALLAVLACTRPAPPAPEQAPPESPPLTTAPAPAPAPALASALVLPQGEARREIVPTLERLPSLRPQLGLLRDHFSSFKGPFDVQSIALSDGRSAFLVSGLDEMAPIALALDRDQLAWSKQRPVAGILTPVQHLAIAPRPDGGVALFAWVAQLRVVAARMWADDGNPFGDFELFAPSACDSLSAAYGPGFGWVVVCASAAGALAERMREDAVVAWPKQGVSVGARGASGPATIAFDTHATFVVVQRAAAVGGDRVLAQRYDGDGEPLWPTAATVGAVGADGSVRATARLEARNAGDGVVRVELPHGVAGRPTVRGAEIDSTGTVKLVHE